MRRVRFDEPAGFFDYDSRWIDAGLGLEVRPNLRAAFIYRFESVPPAPERSEAESHSNTVGLSLRGDIVPLVTGEIAVGFQDRASPRAGPGGTRYQGLAASFQLEKQLGRSSTLALSGGRFTRLSAFEANGFYVSSSVAAQLSFPLPLSLSGQGGAGYGRNHYRVAAAALGVPRKDHVSGWSVGIGRAIGRWAFVRADYRKGRRTSNLDPFENRTRTLTVQAAVGIFGTQERAR